MLTSRMSDMLEPLCPYALFNTLKFMMFDIFPLVIIIIIIFALEMVNKC